MIKKYLKRILIIIIAVPAFLIAIFTTGLWWPLDSAVPVNTKTPIIIVNVTVVDVKTGTLQADKTVLVMDNRIAAVANANEVSTPSAAQIIDGRNRFLIPALWDMHTHIYKFSPLLDMPLYIGYGVTNVRDMMGCPLPDDPLIACPEDKSRWTREAVAGRFVGPRILGHTSFMANGPVVLDRIKGIPDFFATATPEQARKFVRHFAGRVDSIKVYDNIPRQAYFALVDEAKQQGIDVVGHRPRAITAIEAAENQKSIEHGRFILHEAFSGSAQLRELAGASQWREDRRRMLDEHDPEMAQAIFAAMARSGTWYVPTHLTRRVDAYAEEPLIREDPLLRYLHPLMKWQWMEDVNGVIQEDPSPEARETYREFYKKGLELTGAAHRAGVGILAGTDYIVAGATVHDELQQLVLAGLSPADALRAATLSPAEYFGLEQEYGQVAEGMAADLILLNKNPLADIRNTLSIESVVFNGNLYERNALDEISAHVQRQARSWTVACKILWRFIKNPIGY